jgi:hypothetical protein
LSKELETLLDEIQFKTQLTLEEIAQKIGYSRPWLNKQKKSGGGKKLVGILKEAFQDELQKDTNNNKMAIGLDKESMAKEILHLKAVVKAQGQFLAKIAADHYNRPVADMMKELRDNTMLIMLDQGDS